MNVMKNVYDLIVFQLIISSNNIFHNDDLYSLVIGAYLKFENITRKNFG